jgi:uncharacterized protein YkwD
VNTKSETNTLINIMMDVEKTNSSMMQSQVATSSMPPRDQIPAKQGRSIQINAATKDRLRQAQAKKKLGNWTTPTPATTKVSKDRKSQIGAAMDNFLDSSVKGSTKSFVPTAPVTQSPPKASRRRSSKTGAAAAAAAAAVPSSPDVPIKTESKRANYFEMFGKSLSSRFKDGLSSSDHHVRKNKAFDPLSQSEHIESSTRRTKKASSKRISKPEDTNGDLGSMLSKMGGAPKKRGARSVVSMPAGVNSDVAAGQERRPRARKDGEVRKRSGSIGPIDTGRKRSGSIGPIDTGRKRSGSIGPIDTAARRSSSTGPNADARARRRQSSTVSSSGGSSMDGPVTDCGSVGSKDSKGSMGSKGSQGSNGSKGSKSKNKSSSNGEKKAKRKSKEDVLATTGEGLKDETPVEKVKKVKPTKKLSKANGKNGEPGSMRSMVSKKKGAKSVRKKKGDGPALGKKINKSKRMSSMDETESSKLVDPDLDIVHDDAPAPVPPPPPKSKKTPKGKSKKQLVAPAAVIPDVPADVEDDWAASFPTSQRSLCEKSEKSSRSSRKDYTSSSNDQDDDCSDELSLSLDDIGAPDAFEAQEETTRAMAKKAVPRRVNPPGRPAAAPPGMGPGMGLQRGQSMMLQRDTTRRAGKTNSLQNLVEYTEEELPSTSYFASNHILINRERMKRGLRPLSRNSTMDELARDHADKMATSKGCSPIQTTFVGNVCRGESIRSIHRITMQHKDGRERYNILNPYFQDFGVGTSKGDDGMLYMCQLFSERIELTCMDTQDI